MLLQVALLLLLLCMTVVVMVVESQPAAAGVRRRQHHRRAPPPSPSAQPPNMVVVAIASAETDGYQRFMYSAKNYGYNITFLKPIGEFTTIQKATLSQKFLEPHKNDTNLIFVYADSYDAVFNEPPAVLDARFRALKDTNILFGAGIYCQHYAYRSTNAGPNRCLNAGVFMGYAASIYQLVSDVDFHEHSKRDQIQFIKLFKNQAYREKMKFRLDHHNAIIQNIKLAADQIELDYTKDPNNVKLVNKMYGTTPVIIHGAGKNGKKVINYVGNFLAGVWTPTSGCKMCRELQFNTTRIRPARMPKIMIAVKLDLKHSEAWTTFFSALSALNYPKSHIHVRLLDTDSTKQTLTKLHDIQQLSKHYASLKILTYYRASNFSFGMASADAVLLRGVLTLITPLMSSKRGIISTLPKYHIEFQNVMNHKQIGVWNVKCTALVHLIRLKFAFRREIMDIDAVETLASKAACGWTSEFFNFLSNQYNFGYIFTESKK